MNTWRFRNREQREANTRERGENNLTTSSSSSSILRFRFKIFSENTLHTRPKATTMAADPNPKKFPVLSYVLARLPSFTPAKSSSSAPAFDVEQPPPQSSIEIEMPHLAEPGVLASMTKAITDVAETRSVLRTLGPRPDHEAVDRARAKLNEIEGMLSESFEDIALTEAAGEDEIEKRRREMDQEKTWCESILKLDEVHGSYEKLLSEAEERLVRIYEFAEKKAKVEEGEGGVEEVEVNEEVVGILQEALANPVERVDLSGRKLSLLPEAFGRIQGLLVLNLSNNQLQVCSHFKNRDHSLLHCCE